MQAEQQQQPTAPVAFLTVLVPVVQVPLGNQSTESLQSALMEVRIPIDASAVMPLVMSHLAASLDPSVFADLSQGPRGPPSASEKVVQELPEVDLTEETCARCTSCTVCLEDFAVGGKALRLPCQHLFHRDCILPWLQLHNTCPSCRHELPTDDPEYERAKAERAQRAAQHQQQQHPQQPSAPPQPAPQPQQQQQQQQQQPFLRRFFLSGLQEPLYGSGQPAHVRSRVFPHPFQPQHQPQPQQQQQQQQQPSVPRAGTRRSLQPEDEPARRVRPCTGQQQPQPGGPMQPGRVSVAAMRAGLAAHGVDASGVIERSELARLWVESVRPAELARVLRQHGVELRGAVDAVEVRRLAYRLAAGETAGPRSSS